MASNQHLSYTQHSPTSLIPRSSFSTIPMAHNLFRQPIVSSPDRECNNSLLHRISGITRRKAMSCDLRNHISAFWTKSKSSVFVFRKWLKCVSKAHRRVEWSPFPAYRIRITEKLLRRVCVEERSWNVLWVLHASLSREVASFHLTND